MSTDRVSSPTDDQLSIYGFAPGGYTGVCVDCKDKWLMQDKRAWRCRPCAVKKFQVRIMATLDGIQAEGPPLAEQSS